MKCPLLLLGYHIGFKTEPRSKADCLKEECTWWRDDIQMCAIKDLSLELMYAQMRLADMLEKMPKWEQFGK